MECLTIFFSLLSMILAHSIMGRGGNKEIRGRVFSTVQVWKKWNVPAFSFHDTCTVSLGKKEIEYGPGFYLV
jgi:hypothetical protein